MNKKDREDRNWHIINQYTLGASKKDLALLHNMTVQNINAIIKKMDNKIRQPDGTSSKDSIPDDIKDFVTRMDKLNTIPSNLKPKNARNITFKDKIDAEIILEKMVEFIVLRGKASLAIFYLLNGMKCHKHDHSIGWESASYFIKNTKIMFLGPDKGYRINLAPTTDIEYDMVNDMLPKDKMVKIYES